MCEYCDGKHENIWHNIYQDSLTEDYYLSVCTDEWDNIDNDYVYEKIFINYCP